MKKLSLMLIIFVVLVAFEDSTSAAKDKVVTKNSCLMLGDYPDKGVNEIRTLLLIQAKQAALNEIYGEMIRSTTEVKRGVLTMDLLTADSLGLLRVKGDPRYYNGPNFGEVCVEITGYVTEKDLKKFQKIPVAIKKYCFSNPDIPIRAIKERAREAAVLELVKKHRPALKDIDPKIARHLIHDLEISNENLDLNTAAYCLEVKAQVIPFELEFAVLTRVESPDSPTAKGKPTPKASAKKAGAVIYALKLDKYDIGDPLPEIGQKAVFLIEKDSNKPYIGQMASGEGFLEFKSIKLPANFTLSFDIWPRGNSYFVILSSSSRKKEFRFWFSYENHVKFPNNVKVNGKVNSQAWIQIWLKRKGNAFKVYAKDVKEDKMRFVGSTALTDVPPDLDTLRIRQLPKMKFRNIKVIAD